MPNATRPRAAALLAAATLLAALGPAAEAQQTTPAAGADTARGARRPTRLDGVTVRGTRRARGYLVTRTRTATKTSTPLRDVPQAVTVVTRQLIADQAMQGMADVVRYTPGVTMALGEGHRDAPTIRGQSTTADFFVDGVRDDVQYYRDLYNADRVEVLKGSNAMVFGRGGGGGVINRVTKQAEWAPSREVSVSGGSYEARRGTLDVGGGAGPAALRLNAMYENSGGWRDAAHVNRAGVNPTAALRLGDRTTVRAGYEHFRDGRVVDRGVPSYRGAPAPTGLATFFGDPDANTARARVDAGSVTVEHQASPGLVVRNRSWLASYRKFYQNVFPGAVDSTGARVALAAYNNATDRHNLFNQTDVTGSARTGGVRHTLLVGTEFGRQATGNFRETGYFGAAGTATSLSVPLAASVASGTGVVFRQSATDANNRATLGLAAVYAQDQLALTRRLQAVLGLRYDRFDLRVDNRRTGATLRRDDRLVSPRAGLVFKPAEPLSLYSSYSVSYLPSAGDQFSSLTPTQETLRPERFRNRELGAKWDAARGLALTGAVYRLDRTNTAAPDPLNPALTVQTGAQRTTGYELGATGDVTDAWQVAGGFGQQRAVLVSTTAAAKAGATVALVPRTQASLWNRVRLTQALGAGLGVVHQTRMYAAVDNTVVLPGFTRFDAALFASLGRGARAQLNVENLFDRRYWATSQGNNNIMPGAPRLVRLTLATGLP